MGPVRLPQDEVLPVYGGYPDGFWDREIEGYREEYKVHYFFQHERNDHTIGDDLRAKRRVIDNVDRSRYPYLTCEMGGGMHASYHRRPRLSADDIAAMAWVTVGSGGNLQGYYMYHGGSNPEGKLITLQESQATGYPNDMPIVNYDMQAPLREFGQSNRSYHILRSLHLFCTTLGTTLRRWSRCFLLMGRPGFRILPASVGQCGPTNATVTFSSTTTSGSRLLGKSRTCSLRSS